MIQIAGRWLPLGRLLGQQQGAVYALPSLVIPHAVGGAARTAATASDEGLGRSSSGASPSLRHLPAPSAYDISLVIKGFELRFVKQASTVIRDLMLLCFAPKHISTLPSDLQRGGYRLGSVRGTDVALAVPLGDRALPTRRTVFTVIRGPHVHKISREQFQRLVHRRVIHYPTTSYMELQWFLDAIKSYDFAGVQIQVKIASRSFLVPPPLDTESSAAAPRPLLADHMARFPHLFSAVAAYGGGGGGGSAFTEAAMADSFRQLREGARSELLHERLLLQRKPQYKDWLKQQNNDSIAAAAEAAAAEAERTPGGGIGGLAAIGQAVARELSSSGGGYAGQQLEDALAAAAMKVLAAQGLPEQLTGASDHAAALLAKAPLSEVSGQQLVDVLYSTFVEAKQREQQQRQREQEGQQQPGQPQAANAAEAAESYADVARALVQQLLEVWWSATNGQLRAELAMPGYKGYDLPRATQAASASAARPPTTARQLIERALGKGEGQPGSSSEQSEDDGLGNSDDDPDPEEPGPNEVR